AAGVATPRPFAVAGAAGGAGERGDGLGHGAVVAAWRAGCKPRGSCRRAGGFAPPSSYTTIPRDIFMMKKERARSRGCRLASRGGGSHSMARFWKGRPLASPRPFSRYEFMIAWRYLRARRAEGGVSVMTWISLIGIALGVMALIATLAVRVGFRAEFVRTILGAYAHSTLYLPPVQLRNGGTDGGCRGPG